MKNQRALMAKQLLSRKQNKKAALPVKNPMGAPQSEPQAQPQSRRFDNVHPAVLEHVNNYLEQFKKGLGG